MEFVVAEADGHGTHVAGSIGGAQSGEVAGDDDADGMAFQGKLAVFDFGDSDNFNALTTPDEVCSSCSFLSFLNCFFCALCFFHVLPSVPSSRLSLVGLRFCHVPRWRLLYHAM